MIVDAHVYCFPPADQPSGHSSGKDHLKWVQAAHEGHHQPSWRVRDRSAASSECLPPLGVDRRLDLPDLNFRGDHERGRVLWTVGGEDYTKQFYPPI